MPGASHYPLVSFLRTLGMGLLVMLKVYLDLGAKRDLTDGVVCVAAIVFKPTAL